MGPRLRRPPRAARSCPEGMSCLPARALPETKQTVRRRPLPRWWEQLASLADKAAHLYLRMEPRRLWMPGLCAARRLSGTVNEQYYGDDADCGTPASARRQAFARALIRSQVAPTS